ncbi:hypothetical protein ACFFWC_00380 [Plantactinospora siamensis]|uniref:Uncharacterized protein n=1 Tax=Plantactinospora siamensis TaxID=555372 RepID=A0ABV6NU20_9ACTN
MSAAAPVITCPVCSGRPDPGPVGAGPFEPDGCPACAGRGRLRAQLVLTVANIDTGAVRSAVVEPGRLDVRPVPGGGWRVALTARIGELAEAAGVAGTPDELTLRLPADWDPELPADRRYDLEARAVAECWREPWRVAIGRSGAPNHAGRRLGRFGLLAGQAGGRPGAPGPLTLATLVRLAHGLDLALLVTLRDGVPVPAPSRPAGASKSTDLNGGPAPVGLPGLPVGREARTTTTGAPVAVLRWPDGPRWELRLLSPAAPVPVDEFPTAAGPRAAVAALIDVLDLAFAERVPVDPHVAIPAPDHDPVAVPGDPVPELIRLAARHAGRAITVRFTRAGCELYLLGAGRARRSVQAADLPALMVARPS